MEKYVFISYSTKNLDYALKLDESLKAKNIEVYLDKEKIRGGNDWAKKYS